RVCAKCGAPATVTRQKTFSWHPGWVFVFILLGALGILLMILLLIFNSKRMRVPVPLFHAHRNHWSSRLLIILAGLGVLAVAAGIGYAVSNDEDRGTMTFLVLFGGGLAWLILAIITQVSVIRATEITDRSITLNNVSRRFVEAVREARRGE